MNGKRAWKVQQGNRTWKRPRKLRDALDLARHLLWGSDTPVTVTPFIVPVKRRKAAPQEVRITHSQPDPAVTSAEPAVAAASQSSGDGDDA